MNEHDLMVWISKKSVEIFHKLKSGGTNDREINKLVGAYEVLEEMRMHILVETNPHKREDIEKFKKKRAEAESK